MEYIHNSLELNCFKRTEKEWNSYQIEEDINKCLAKLKFHVILYLFFYFSQTYVEQCVSLITRSSVETFSKTVLLVECNIQNTEDMNRLPTSKDILKAELVLFC